MCAGKFGAPFRQSTRNLALPENITLGWKGLQGTNTLAYFTPLINYWCKEFYNIDPSSRFYKTLFLLCKKLERLSVAKLSQRGLLFVGKAWSLNGGSLETNNVAATILSLAKHHSGFRPNLNIRPGWWALPRKNILAFYKEGKRFCEIATWGCNLFGFLFSDKEK